MTGKNAVNAWIVENFVIDSVQIVDCNLLPHGKRVVDKDGNEMLVFWDILRQTVKYTFPT